jgi:hypothetical protein
MDAKLRKDGRIPEWLEDRPSQRWTEVDLSRSAVAETEPHYIAADVPCLDNVIIHGDHSSGALKTFALFLATAFPPCRFRNNVA